MKKMKTDDQAEKYHEKQTGTLLKEGTPPKVQKLYTTPCNALQLKNTPQHITVAGCYLYVVTSNRVSMRLIIAC